jgi:hypothetical protein
MTPQASISTPSDLTVIAEDKQEYLLPSAFGLRVRTMEALSMDLGIAETRLSRLEDLIADRMLGTKH